MPVNPRRTDVLMDLHETWNFQITCHDDADGTIVSNLVNCSISIAVDDINGVNVLNAPGVILNPATNGIALIQVSPTQQTTAGISAGTYTYTIRLVRADSTISDQAFGSLTVRGTEYG